MNQNTDSAESTAAIDRKNAVEATISVDKLDRFLEGVHAVVEEAKIQFDSDGVHCYAVDPANVAFVETHLDEGHFSDYTAVDCVIGAEIRKLRTVLEVLDGTIEVAVNVAEQTIAFDDGDAQYETTYLNPDTVRDADTERDWTRTTEVYVAGDALQRGVTLASEVGDHIELEYTAETETLRVFADEDRASSSVEVNPASAPQNNDGEGYYSEDYLSDLIDAVPSGASVSVGIGDEVPLELGIANNGIEVNYALAPRIRGAD